MSRQAVTVREALLEPGARDLRRARTDWIMRRVVASAAFLAVLPLFALVIFVTIRALPWLNPAFFFNNPLDTEPGVLNAVIGSLQMSALALLVTGPIGVAGGVYLSEFASARVASAGEMVIDILLGIPSIVAGLFAFLLLVPILGFSGWAGSLALGVLTLPIVMRTTQEVMRLVPPSIREASLALGIPVWRTTLLVTLRTALPGVLTGLVLAASRALGETAPLIMTAKGTNASNFLDFGTTMNAMPLVIFRYAEAADDRTIGQAWATALVLMVIALALNVIVRWRTIDSRVA
jgi:phosphate transport system permease protein